MKTDTLALPLSIGALVLGATAQMAALVSGHVIDVSEWLSALHGYAERYDLDELLLAILVLGVALGIDFIRTRAVAQVKSAERERERLEQSYRTLLEKCDGLERKTVVLHETRGRLVENERLAWAVVSRLRRGLLNRLAGVGEALDATRQESRTIAAPHLVESLGRVEAELRRITEFVAGLPDMGESDRVLTVADPRL
jgi:hypothetical protein